MEDILAVCERLLNDAGGLPNAMPPASRPSKPQVMPASPHEQSPHSRHDLRFTTSSVSRRRRTEAALGQNQSHMRCR